MPTAQQLNNIFMNKLGLRVGVNLDGAAYAMEDFGMDESSALDILKWVMNPTSNNDRLQQWDEHLYNTIWKIFDITDVPFNLLIVSNARHGGKHAESYKAGNGVGDKLTFKKCNRLPHNSAIIAQRLVTAQDGIQDIIQWVNQNI